MKYFLLLFMCFNVYAVEKTWKIQVFNSNGSQLYGLYATEGNRSERLADAMKFHIPGETILIDEDITIELEEKEAENLAAKEERKNLKNFIKDIQDPNVKKILSRLVKDHYKE